MNEDFFNTDVFIVDEKVKFHNISNSYCIYNREGETIGYIQEEMPFGRFISRILGYGFFNSKTDMKVCDKDGNVQFTFSSNKVVTTYTFKLVAANGKPFGTIEEEFDPVKSSFKLYNGKGQRIANILTHWKQQDFYILDKFKKVKLGHIDKKWGGVLKELFTTADKYSVIINQNDATPKTKALYLASAIVIDISMKSGKRSGGIFQFS